MLWWGLLIELLAVWLLWGVAAAVGRAVADARRGIPEGQRGDVSIAPIVPVIPLIFWGLAWLADLGVSPWGTRVIGWFHVVLGVVFTVSIAIDWWRLRSLDRSA